MNSFQSRLATFEAWPKADAVRSRDLASAGLFYLGPADRVRCAFCRGEFEGGDDDPMTEHRTRFGSTCPYLRAPCIPTLFFDVHREPRHPAHGSLTSRLATYYAHWPGGLRPSVAELGRAGFFYTGENDLVRCFHCGGTLNDWRADEDPWTVHAVWFPMCPFVRREKGAEFVPTDAGGGHRRASVNGELFRPSIGAMAAAQTDSADATARLMDAAGRCRVKKERTTKKVGKKAPPPCDEIASAVERTPGVRADEIASAVERIRKKKEEIVEVERACDELREQRTCVICLDKEMDVVFRPCGHMACGTCAQALKKCPICRGEISAAVRITPATQNKKEPFWTRRIEGGTRKRAHRKRNPPLVPHIP